MFEIGIFSLIVLAVSYWAILWVMGRREDVLHGEFVKADAQPGEPVRVTFPEQRVRPVFPDRPAIPDRPTIPERQSFPDRPAFPQRPSLPERSALTERPVLTERTALPERPVQATVPEQAAFRPERLEQLLASIKQDLNQLVQK
ncbi:MULTISPECIES: hypothetical protein [Bradyrhizobium]|jgi:hypothetical protein|uniref:Uncharacterized protein n=2 Tax=Bradyrhizobium TaxID=374 RepID=A0ABY0QC80_9BRAD|nr:MULTISPECIES: hypothetical protein [Bradyrhizobium]SDJ89568.1 hypothetical protein SAMN05444163_6692 [Bradyrhizobium ottawaense]SEC01971.1 hypothetical protein SAMN05444171_0466 [Bradyrhizobium lablabi]SHM68655.1 hypothetical protein SAMN05444321_7245 [Bradyrhizobium lablabi]